jgi:hypothetical protein
MDKDELQKNIALYYSKLPPKAQEVFAKQEWLTTLGKISEKYGLNEKQKETLGTETTLLLLGIIHPVEFEENLNKELGVDAGTLEKILVEMNNSILKDIHQQLVETFNANKKSKTSPAENTSDIVQTAEAQFEKLPKNIGDILRDSDFQTTLYGIAQEHKLSVTEMDVLDTVTTDLITGAIHPNEFKKSLLNKLDLPEGEVSTLVDEINEKIFKKIRQKMMGLNLPAPEELLTPEADMEVLKSHGIEILQEGLPAVPEAQLLQAGKLELTPAKPDVHPILAQKMSAPVQTPTVKSNYGINNVPISTGEIKPPVPPQTPKTSTYKPGTDPYRIHPDL